MYRNGMSYLKSSAMRIQPPEMQFRRLQLHHWWKVNAEVTDENKSVSGLNIKRVSEEKRCAGSIFTAGLLELVSYC